jgi:xylan 1,4-beta-xylosidase
VLAAGAGSVGSNGSGRISVNGTAAGAPLRRIWAYYGFDEVNYTTTPEGRHLLQALVRAYDEPVHIRSHFLLNADAGALGLKWGSTNVYTQDAQGNAPALSRRRR